MFLNKLKNFFVAAIFFITLISSHQLEDFYNALAYVVISLLISYRITQAYISENNFSILRLFKYLIWLFIEIAKASIETMKVILNVKPYDPMFTKVRVQETDDVNILYADSITLTPGTTSITFSDQELSVHCLNSEFAESLNDKTMINKIKALKNG